MSQRGILAYKLFKRGSLIHIPDFRFKENEIKGKYALLMEDCDTEMDTVVVILGTSDTNFKNKKWTVFIKKGTVKNLPQKDGVFDCNNWHELPKRLILQKKCRFICYLDKHVMAKIDKALEYAYRMPSETIIRIRPKSGR